MSERAKYTIDLHIHTINSDGRETTETVLSKAARRGVRVVVFAEHSRADTYAEARELCGKYGVEVPFPAVEISTIFADNRHHVLAYGPAVLDQVFQAYTSHPTEYKNCRHAAIVEALRARGVGIPTARDIMRGLQPDGTYRFPLRWMLSRTAIAEAVAQALGTTTEEARSLFMDGYDPARRLVQLEPDLSPGIRYLDTIQTIRAVRRAGALPVLAHPWWELSSGRTTVDRLLGQIAAFREVGLEGIETLSYHYTPEQIPADIDLADRFGLFSFGGSDYHGNGRSELGDVGVTAEQFYHIAARVAAMRPSSVGASPRFAAVIFDAGFTLLHDRQSPTALVRAALARSDKLQPTDEQMVRAERRAQATLPPPQVMWRDDRSIQRALRIYYHTFLAAFTCPVPGHALEDELIARYTAVNNWQLYPEVKAALALLRLYGVRIGVVANWQSTLPALLDALGISPYIDFVLPSAAANVAKPDPALFEAAARLAGCDSRQMLYVGDDPAVDRAGACAAGLSVAVIDRPGSGAFYDLRQVVALAMGEEVTV